MGAKLTTYRGHDIIELVGDVITKYPFRFGVTKAKLILDNIGEIENFVARHDDAEEFNEKYGTDSYGLGGGGAGYGSTGFAGEYYSTPSANRGSESHAKFMLLLSIHESN